LAKASGVAQRIKLDPTLARGLAYYTGAIIEINVADLAGSLGGGGRYDNLVGMFLGRDVAACGFSLGLERIIVVMSEREMFPKELVSSPADIMVTIWYHKESGEKEEAAKDSLRLARELRSLGLRVDVYPVRNVKLATQMAYASKRGIPFVATIGDDERLQAEFSLKDMRSGEQLRLPFEELKKLQNREPVSQEKKEPSTDARDKLFRWFNKKRAGEAGDGIKPGA
jgi:histidyl-tRNA synthetase